MRLKGLFRKIAAIGVVLLMLYPSCSELVYAVAELNTPLVVGNDFIEYTVNQTDGRFSIRTTQGSPWKKDDDGQQLLYENIVPETSFTTIKIDGEDYIYGNNYGFLGGTDGSFTSAVNNVGMLTESKWVVKGVQVTQRVQLYEDTTNPYIGNVKITYAIKNTSDVTKAIGTRVLLDTMLGVNDASPVVLDGSSEFITTETELSGDEMPNYWRATDDVMAPKVLSYGFLDGWGNTKPDKMIIGHWDGISETKWDYSVDRGINFTSKQNEYGSADSAVALFWQPTSVAPGQEIVYETYYGLGNFYEEKSIAKYGLQVTAPTQLTLNADKTGYVEEYYDISAEIDNSYDDATYLANVEVSLGVTEGIKLLSDEVITFQSIGVGDIKSVTWRVKALPQDIYKACQYVVTVKPKDTQSSLKGGYTVLPALSGEPPSVQVQNITPATTYYLEEEPIITLEGKGFEVLKADNDWYVELQQQSYGLTNQYIRVPGNMISITDDEHITITTNDAFWTDNFGNTIGQYKIRLWSERYGLFTKTIEMTDDIAYMTRGYGKMLIVGHHISPDRYGDYETGSETYEIVVLDDDIRYDKESYERSLNAAGGFEKDHQVLLEIVGDIKEVTVERKNNGQTIYTKEYYIPPGCFINSVIEYGTNDVLKLLYGDTSQKMVVKEVYEGNKKTGIDISGNGMVSIPHFPFVHGNFQIGIENGSRFSLEPDEENDIKPIEIQWDVLKGMKYLSHIDVFPVKIKNAWIGDKAVSFGGSVYLNLGGNIIKWDDEEEGEPASETVIIPGKNDKKEEEIPDLDEGFGDSLSLSLDMQELKWGMIPQETLFAFGERGSFGFIGLRAEAEVGMPSNLIPSVKFGANARVLVDTLDNVFEAEVDVNFKAIEFGGLLTLRFLESMPVVDNLKGYVGGEPGIPIIPPTPPVFITKGGIGIENIYDTVMLNFNYIPPLTLSFKGSADIVKMLGITDAEVSVSLRGIGFTGDISIAKLDLFRDVHGSMMFIDEGGGGFVTEVGASLNIFDVLVGSVNFTSGYDSSYSGVKGKTFVRGNGDVGVQVPTFVPIVGGMGVGSVSAELSTKRAYVEPRILNIPIGIEYTWGTPGVDVEVGMYGPSISSLDGYNQIEFADHGLAREIHTDEASGEVGLLVYGTNISRITTVNNRPHYTASSGEIGEQMSLSAVLNDSYDIDVQGRDAVIFEIAYDDQVPEIQCLRPDGSSYELVTDQNYRVQEIGAEHSASGHMEKRIYITAVDPEDGKWVIKSDRPVTVSLLNVKMPAQISQLEVEQKLNDHELSATWQSSNITNEKVALYLCSSQEAIGRVILDDINASDGKCNLTVPDSYASGDYFLRAVLYEDETNYKHVVSDNSISIVNQKQPLSPTEIQVETAGNGIIKAVWDPVDGVDGYHLTLKDENGLVLDTAGAVEIEGNVGEAHFGGTYKDLDGNLLGMIPGKSYILAINSYKEVEGKTYISEERNSLPLYIPVPSPAVLACSVVTTSGKVLVETDNEGKETVTIDKSQAAVKIKSDQLVDIVVKVNQEWVSTTSGKDVSVDVELNEGENLLQVFSSNENGDTSIDSLTILSDTTAPELRINEYEETDVNGQAYVIIKGMTEIGVELSLDGQELVVDDQGDFTTQLSMNNIMNKDITLVAEDEIGNKIVCHTTAFSRSVKNLDLIEIKASAIDGSEDDSGKYEAKVGEEIQLDVYAIGDDGKEYLMSSEDIQWDILVGEGIGEITDDGRLKLENTGEIIIKASYQVSDNYTFGDTITIKVVRDDGSTQDKDYDGDDFKEMPDSQGNNNSQGSDSSSSGSTSNSGNGASSTSSSDSNVVSIVDALLPEALERLIANEKNMTLLKQLWVGDELKEIQADDYMDITFPRQGLLGRMGFGIWKVNDTTSYQKPHLQFLSDIYEMVLDSTRSLENQVTLVFDYEPSEVRDISKLAVYWYDEAEDRWEYVGGIVDEDKHTVTVLLDHFSQYALIYNSEMNTFMDIQGRWSRDVIYSLSSIGVIDGIKKEDGYYYHPEDEITRQEFTKLLVEAMGGETASSTNLSAFADSSSIHSWALPYMKVAVDKEWLSGSISDDTLSLKPLDPITRGEAVVMVGRILEIDSDTDVDTAFMDMDSIPSWARGYVTALKDLGIINGYPDHTFRASNPISREEAAAIVMRMISEMRKEEK